MKTTVLFMMIAFTLLNVRLNAQQISGKVIDQETGKGIVATLTVNKQAIATDSAGNFKLKLFTFPSRMKISAIGYKSLDTLLSNTVKQLLFSLQSKSSTLNEVIISTGYQQISKERLTGAVEQISQSTLQNQVSTNILSRIEAVAGGLNIDRATSSTGTIAIRGLSSINGPKGVLIILDNFPFDGDINSINPNDVENISILKDAAATSIWGSRAGNGVIVISTKQGKHNSALNVQAQATTSFLSPPDLYRRLQMNSSDFIDVELFLYGKGYYDAAYNSPARPGITPVIELMYNTQLNAQEKESAIAALRQRDVRDDFKKWVYENGLNQQYSVQASAGNQRYHWLASVGYDTNKDQLSTTYQRLSLRYALTANLTEQLKLNVGLNYANVNSLSGKEGITDVSALNGTIYPYAALADETGNALPLVRDYRLSYLQNLDQRLLDWKYYPLNDYRHNRTKGISDDVNINAGLSYQWKEWKLNVLYRLQRQKTTNENLQNMESYNARNLLNGFTQLSSTNATYILPLGGIRNYTAGTLWAQDLRLQTNYDRSFGNHQLTAFVSAETRQLNNQRSTTRYYGYDSNTLLSAPVDMVNPYPHFITGSNSIIPNAQSQAGTNNRFVSLLGNLGYNFKHTYFFYASTRFDGSNLFGVNTNDKWEPLWSIGAAWILSKNWKMPSFVNHLKLRTSYGKSGNADPNRTGLTTISYYEVSPFTNTQFAGISRFYNPDLKWETVATANIGVDLRLFASRLNFTIDYYRKVGKDLFGVYPVDYTTGVGASIMRNVASMNSNGLDINIDGRVFQAQQFQWQAILNFSINNDKVTRYYSTATRGNDYIGNGTISGMVGKPVYGVFSYPYLGLDAQGDPIGLLNGVESKDYAAITGTATKIQNLRFNGTALPTKFGNLLNRFSYRSFSLEFSLSYKLGYYFRRSSIQYSNLVASRVGHPDYALRWQKPGDETHTHVPAFQYPVSNARSLFHQNAEVLVAKADHVRIQYINLAWETSKPIGSTLKGIRAFLNCTNLGLLWADNKERLDPDYLNGLRPAPMYSAGINLKF
jgi:TonB-linked SusC/RagA family outer membrane protein